ncbi:phage major capsid protein [Pseudomonas putida]|uniref:phage major capsid protein n=1 Tax=Pseudomonas putida TaxID=303 RepID=UPI00370B67A1
MPVDTQDIAQVAQELGARFDEFQQKNNQRLDGIQQEKSKLAESVEKMNGTLTELDGLKGKLEAILAKQDRPGGGGSDSKDVAEHKSAYSAFLRKGNEDDLRELERKALNTLTDEDGGYAVPEELDRTIAELARDTVVMRQECKVITMGGTGYRKLVNVGGTTSGWVGETDDRPETSTPKLQPISPTFGEIYANPMATQGMLDDAFFNVEAWLGEEGNTEFSEQEEAAFSYGNGDKKPKGLFAYATEAKNDKTRTFGKLEHILADAAALSPDDLFRMVHALRKPYRAGAKWMMNNLSLMACRLLRDEQGNYLWRPGLEQDVPSVLLGYGVAENEEMPDIAAQAQAISFGNFKRAYTIIDRIGTRVLRDPYTRKPYVSFYTTKRVGSMLENHQAVKMLQMRAAG